MRDKINLFFKFGKIYKHNRLQHLGERRIDGGFGLSENVNDTFY